MANDIRTKAFFGTLVGVGGGVNAFKVTISYDSGSYVADKTYAEIIDACKAGMHVYAVDSYDAYPLLSLSMSGRIAFANLHLGGSGNNPNVSLGLYGYTIAGNGSVAREGWTYPLATVIALAAKADLNQVYTKSQTYSKEEVDTLVAGAASSDPLVVTFSETLYAGAAEIAMDKTYAEISAALASGRVVYGRDSYDEHIPVVRLMAETEGETNDIVFASVSFFGGLNNGFDAIHINAYTVTNGPGGSWQNIHHYDDVKVLPEPEDFPLRVTVNNGRSDKTYEEIVAAYEAGRDAVAACSSPENNVYRLAEVDTTGGLIYFSCITTYQQGAPIVKTIRINTSGEAQLDQYILSVTT